MRLPNGEILMVTDASGIRHIYDPVKAHQYYLRTRKLKGRKKGSAQPPAAGLGRKGPDPAVRARKKRELLARIANLEDKLQKLEALIKKKETEAKQAAKKSADDKRKAAKEAAKPDTAAEKAKKAREAKQYRAKNQQKIKSKDKGGSGGSSKLASKVGSKAEPKTQSVADLKKLATTVRGQIATAKTRLRSL
jgi:hypothetical protein